MFCISLPTFNDEYCPRARPDPLKWHRGPTILGLKHLTIKNLLETISPTVTSKFKALCLPRPQLRCSLFRGPQLKWFPGQVDLAQVV